MHVTRTYNWESVQFRYKQTALHIAYIVFSLKGDISVKVSVRDETCRHRLVFQKRRGLLKNKLNIKMLFEYDKNYNVWQFKKQGTQYFVNCSSSIPLRFSGPQNFLLCCAFYREMLYLAPLCGTLLLWWHSYVWFITCKTYHGFMFSSCEIDR